MLVSWIGTSFKNNKKVGHGVCVWVFKKKTNKLRETYTEIHISIYTK